MKYPTAPHPTPVATGKGNRTAAADDELFSRYLSDHLTVPDLSLPDTSTARRRLPSIDLSSLMNMISSSSSPAQPRTSLVPLPLIRAAIADVGAFRIVNHGLSPDLNHGDFQQLHRRRYYRYKLPRKLGILIESSTSNSVMIISARVESVCLEMEKIAQALNFVFHKYLSISTRTRPRPDEKSSTGTTSAEPVMWLRVDKRNKSDSDHDEEEEEEAEEEEERDPDRAFTLHYLILGDSELHLRRHDSIIASFNTKPGSLLVTTGNQLRREYWSQLDEDQQVMRNSMEEEEVMITSSCTHDRGPAVSIQLDWPLSSLISQEPVWRGVGTTLMISIFDQILIVMLIALVYDLLKSYHQNP